jgi:CheY-like chemotaxis protein
VEDEAIIALATKLILERQGHTVRSASSGNQALAVVANGPDIDLVLMDIDLGCGMDGTEAAQSILLLRDLPLIFLSSHTERELIEKPNSSEDFSKCRRILKNLPKPALIS